MIVRTIAGVVVISSRLVNGRAPRRDICGYIGGQWRGEERVATGWQQAAATPSVSRNTAREGCITVNSTNL